MGHFLMNGDNWSFMSGVFDSGQYQTSKCRHLQAELVQGGDFTAKRNSLLDISLFAHR